jgi:hypothetical protein
MRFYSLPLAGLVILHAAAATGRADCAATFDIELNPHFNLTVNTCTVKHHVNQTFWDDNYSANNEFMAAANSTGQVNLTDPALLLGPHGLYAAIYCKAYLPLVRSMYQCATDNSCRVGMLADCKNQTSGAFSTFLVRESLGSNGSVLGLNGMGLSCPGVTSCETLFVPVASGMPWSSGTFNLSSLSGTNGFSLNEGVEHNLIGNSVAYAGDVNGDGLADVIVGTYLPAYSGGKTYVLFGSAAGWNASVDVAALNGTNGFVIFGEPGDEIGFVVSAAGDVNGDGVDDMLVLANKNPGGNAFVVFGSTAHWNASLHVGSLNGTNGFAIVPESASHGINAVAAAGDVNGDGVGDVLLHAYFSDLGVSKTFVLFGSRAAWSASISVTALNGTNGFALNGEQGYRTSSASPAGDVNGDGVADVIIGAWGLTSSVGQAYVVFGARKAWNASVELASLNGTNGFALVGVEAFDVLDMHVSSAGDVNADGVDDMLVASEAADSSAGRTYVVFGSAAGWNASLDVTALNGTNGFVLLGEQAYDHSGSSVSAAGDVNRDGIADIVVGADQADSYNGRVYVVFGSQEPWPTALNLSSLNGDNGFAINAEAHLNNLGYSVSSAGDLNGDGGGDLILGAVQSGKVFVVFGAPGPTLAPTAAPTPPTSAPTRRPTSAGNARDCSLALALGLALILGWA